jgi:hypothetical protein
MASSESSDQVAPSARRQPAHAVLGPIYVDEEQRFEVAVVADPPRMLRRELELVLPGVDLEGVAVVLTSQKSAVELINWGPEAAAEKDLLLERVRHPPPGSCLASLTARSSPPRSLRPGRPRSATTSARLGTGRTTWTRARDCLCARGRAPLCTPRWTLSRRCCGGRRRARGAAGCCCTQRGGRRSTRRPSSHARPRTSSRRRLKESGSSAGWRRLRGRHSDSGTPSSNMRLRAKPLDLLSQRLSFL